MLTPSLSCIVSQTSVVTHFDFKTQDTSNVNALIVQEFDMLTCKPVNCHLLKATQQLGSHTVPDINSNLRSAQQKSSLGLTKM